MYKLTLFRLSPFFGPMFILFSLFVFIAGCTDEEETGKMEQPDSPSFSRSSLLSNWADNIIIPGYEDLLSSLQALSEANSALEEEWSAAHLTDVREAWLDSYLSWQRVSMFEIGPAESIGLRNLVNVYPLDLERVASNIALGASNVNFDLPSNNDARGYPLLDYFLFDSTGLVALRDQEQASMYVALAIEHMRGSAADVLAGWKQDYRDDFVSRDGSGATSSFNKMSNDFLFYFEKALRANKVGIPAGVFSTSNVLPDRVEGYYSRVYSGMLLREGLEACKSFFNGRSFSGAGEGSGFYSYLEYLDGLSNNADLAQRIDDQFDAALRLSSDKNDFTSLLSSEPSEMLRLYDEIQKGVVLMKTEMFQAMNVQVDFVDADGD